MMNLIKIEITKIIQNILSVQRISNHEDINKVKQILIFSKNPQSNMVKFMQIINYTSIAIKTQAELKKAKEILNDLKIAIEFSQSNLTDGEQQEFQECLKQANQIYIQGKYQQAKDLFSYCLKLDPININCKWRIDYLRQSNLCGGYLPQSRYSNQNYKQYFCIRLQGKYEEALQYFDRTLLLDEKNFIALSYKGETLRKMQRFAESLIFFEKALVINSKNAVTLFGKGDSLRCQRKYDESLSVLNQGELIDPKNALIQYSKGYTLKAKGQIQQAIECFQKCIAINPQYKKQLEKEIESLKN